MPTITITTSDNGRVIEAKKGDEIVLRLPENPTTGYRWTVDRVSGHASFTDDAYQPDPEMTFGSGGVHTFRLHCEEAGTARAELKHWQEWEGETSVTDRFAVEIQIAG
jgi:inhibitor of cysteine peptidase